jgi:hypothetical protein
MAALHGFSCAGGGAMRDIGSLVAQLDDPLMKEIIGSMHAQMIVLQTDNGAKQSRADQHTMCHHVTHQHVYKHHDHRDFETI